jgi:hypothetical protein
MDEAFAQHMVSSPVNPASKLGLGFEEKGEYAEWSVEEMDRVERELEENDPHGWMRCTFLLGRYQAVRLMQARVPLACIDLAGGNITYPPNIVKGGKGESLSAVSDNTIDQLFIRFGLRRIGAALRLSESTDFAL